MRTRILTISCAMLIALGAMGCGDSPVDPPAPGGGDTGPGFADVPDIPVPATPGGDVPARSDIHTTVKLYTGKFAPTISNAYGRWDIDRVQHIGIGIPDVRTPILHGDAWSSSVTDPFAELIIEEHMSRLLLQDGNGERQPHDISGTEGPSIYETELRFQGEAADKPVYIRRDRHWELKPLEGGAGNYLLLDGPVTGEVSSSYTKGTSTTQTREFGRSVTASVSAGLGALSASVSGTLSETFSTSVTVSESKTETFTKTVFGQSGKIVQFMVWELVEKYTFCDEDGAPYAAPHYVIPTTSMTRRATAVYLQATEFDK